MQENSPAITLRNIPRTQAVRALAAVYLYFIAGGIATVMLGPLLPALTQRWQILDEQAGILFTASFLGQLIGAWFAARNLRASVLYGSALSAIGCIAMARAGFVAAPLVLFCIGVGLGAGLTAGNIITGTVIPASRARLLAMLNVAWGIGAIACPVLLRLSSGGASRFFIVTAACLAAASLCAVAIPRDVNKVHNPSEPLATKTAFPLSTGLLIVFASTMLLYVGVENALGGWLPSYAIRTAPLLRASSISLCFWIAELAGRLLIASIRIDEVILYRISLAVLLATQLVFCTATHLTSTAILALTILSGLALAPLYPLIVAFMLSRTGNHPRLGALFASASLGGASIPWLTGVFSTQFHGLRAGLIVPAAGTGLLLLLSAIVARESDTTRITESNQDAPFQS